MGRRHDRATVLGDGCGPQPVMLRLIDSKAKPSPTPCQGWAERRTGRDSGVWRNFVAPSKSDACIAIRTTLGYLLSVFGAFHGVLATTVA